MKYIQNFYQLGFQPYLNQIKLFFKVIFTIRYGLINVDLHNLSEAVDSLFNEP